MIARLLLSTLLVISASPGSARVDDVFLCRTNLTAWTIQKGSPTKTLGKEFRISREKLTTLAFGAAEPNPWLRIAATPALDCSFENHTRWKNFTAKCTSDNLDVIEAIWSAKEDDEAVFRVSCAARP